jgi:hypothetical protein
MLSGEQPRLSQDQSLIAATVLLCSYCTWSCLHSYRVAYAEQHAQWTTDQWWWGQCTDMAFYEKVQAHMDICDRLRVVPEASIKWAAARQVLRASVAATAILRGCAIFTAAAVVFRLMLSGSYTQCRRARRRVAPML